VLATDRWWRPLDRSDRIAIAVFLIIPVLLFGGPALFGHPAIAADNLIQNYPLRVLTGQQFRTGHLPLLNPLANSTTPLLGGMNAGSFFPATWLFIFLPPLLAWVLNLIAVYVAAALGLFALLRWHNLRTLPAAIAAFVFAYSGSMMGQMVHLGVVQGFALLPWALLAMLSTARAVRNAADAPRRERLRALAPGVMSLALLWGLACLSGEPRAIAEIELLTLIAAPTIALVHSSYQPIQWRQRIGYLVGIAVGVVWGVVIGLGQLLPGWEFIVHSQRSSISYNFFGAGSLVVRWTLMLFDQTINGGNSAFHQPGFFTNYNLPEVTGYVGILALVAVFSFFGRLTRHGWRGDERDYVLYVVLIVVGLFATWGSFTPLGHLFQHIPLYGSTRLQSRNIILVDLGATVLLGWLLSHLLERDLTSLVGRRRWFNVAPAMATVVLCVAMLARGPLIARWMGATAASSAQARHEVVLLVVQITIAGTLCLLLLWMRAHHQLVKWLCVVTVVDVLALMVFSATGFSSGNVNPMPSRAAALPVLGSQGRFALVDPAGRYSQEFENLGSPNQNVFTEIPSVQGYGSLINSLYGNVTYTHPRFSLGKCELARGTFKQLRLSVLAITSDQLATRVTSAVPHPTWCYSLDPEHSTERFFGKLLHVASLTLQGENGDVVSSGEVTAQLFDSQGHPIGTSRSQMGASTMNFDFHAQSRQAAGVRFVAPLGATFYATTVNQSGGRPSYRLNNGFQQALSTTWWTMSHTMGSLTFFRANHIRQSAWLGPNSLSSTILHIKNASWGDSWIIVHATHPTILKRSDEWIPGWRATAVNTRTGSSEALHVDRSGLIMQVTVPTGTWEVHFHYHAPYIELGIASSAGAFVALFVLFGWDRAWWTRNRKDKVLE
jgi:hypothetical protein